MDELCSLKDADSLHNVLNHYNNKVWDILLFIYATFFETNKWNNSFVEHAAYKPSVCFTTFHH